MNSGMLVYFSMILFPTEAVDMPALKSPKEVGGGGILTNSFTLKV